MIFALIFIQGLISGATYANTYYRIHKEVCFYDDFIKDGKQILVGKSGNLFFKLYKNNNQ
jgi:hypothetical protein